MATKKLYLVDTENVGSAWKELVVQKEPKDKILLFYTEKSPHISYPDFEFLCHYTDAFEMIPCHKGKNGLDFQLVSYLGYLLKTAPKTEYIIFSNDVGFDSVVKFWSERDVCVSRVTVRSIKKPEPVELAVGKAEPVPEPVVSKEQEPEKAAVRVRPSFATRDKAPKTERRSIGHQDNGNKPAVSQKTEAAEEGHILMTELSEQKPEPKETSVPVRSPKTRPKAEVDAGLESVIRTEDALPSDVSLNELVETALGGYLPSEFQSDSEVQKRVYFILKENDISKLQKVYQTLSKNFGQEKGTLMYRAIKPHLKDIYNKLGA